MNSCNYEYEGLELGNNDNTATNDKQDHQDTLVNHHQEEVSEWRIKVGLYNATPAVGSPGFQPKDFRNDKGRSVLCRETYFDLLRAVQDISKAARWKFIVLVGILVIFWSILSMVTLVAFGYKDGYIESSSGYNERVSYGYDYNKEHIAWIISSVSSSCCVSFLVWKWAAPRIYHQKDRALEELVALKQKELQTKYGLQIGYRSKKKSSHWRGCWPKTWLRDRSCIWIRGSHRAGCDYHDMENCLMNAKLNTKECPPIFTSGQVPGDICIHETQYHPSMIYSEETLKLKREIHTKQVSNGTRRVAALVLGIALFPYSLPLSLIAKYFGLTVASASTVFVLCILKITKYIKTRLMLKAYQKSAQKLTEMLNDPERNHALFGCTVQLKSMDMPTIGITSHWYEIAQPGSQPAQ